MGSTMAGTGRIKKKYSRKRRNAVLVIGWTIGCVIPAVILLMAVGIFLLREIGEKNLRKNAINNSPQLSAIQMSEPVSKEEKQEDWQEGWVKYDGKIYAYNQDILTFLIMGIDKDTQAVEVEEGMNGGQADALFLVALNPHTSKVEILGINRNTMTDIDVYDETGDLVKTVKGQISTQHGFGDGVEKSCEYQVEAVSKFLYSLPVHGYAAINMSAIAGLNDAVGGVDVTVLEDLTKADGLLQKDSYVHLEGQSAFWYVKYRDVSVFGSADMRFERQKQYLTEFIKKAKVSVKQDLSTVIKLYQAAAPMMTTDITADEAVYLASQALDYQISKDSFHMLEGETVMGERFEEFYPDEKALYELLLEVFYEEVER